jgi:hypothetical protein
MTAFVREHPEEYPTASAFLRDAITAYLGANDA